MRATQTVLSMCTGQRHGITTLTNVKVLHAPLLWYRPSIPAASASTRLSPWAARSSSSRSAAWSSSLRLTRHGRPPQIFWCQRTAAEPWAPLRASRRLPRPSRQLRRQARRGEASAAKARRGRLCWRGTKMTPAQVQLPLRLPCGLRMERHMIQRAWRWWCQRRRRSSARRCPPARAAPLTWRHCGSPSVVLADLVRSASCRMLQRLKWLCPQQFARLAQLWRRASGVMHSVSSACMS